MKKIKNFKLFEKFADKEGINVGDYFYFDIDLKNIDNHKIQSRHEQDNY